MKRVVYHAHIVECIQELEHMALGRYPEQTQSELHDHVTRVGDLLKKITLCIPEVAPVEKSAKRLEREEKQRQRELPKGEL